MTAEPLRLLPARETLRNRLPGQQPHPVLPEQRPVPHLSVRHARPCPGRHSDGCTRGRRPGASPVTPTTETCPPAARATVGRAAFAPPGVHADPPGAGSSGGALGLCLDHWVTWVTGACTLTVFTGKYRPPERQERVRAQPPGGARGRLRTVFRRSHRRKATWAKSGKCQKPT